MNTNEIPCAACQWRDAANCPSRTNHAWSRDALLVRIDATPLGLVTCACRGPIPTPEARDENRSAATIPPDPYLDTTDLALADAARQSWAVLGSLLRDPMEGLAALGLTLLPDRLQVKILEALDEGREVLLRVNLDLEASGYDGIGLVALRALCLQQGIRLEIRHIASVPGFETHPGAHAGAAVAQGA